MVTAQNKKTFYNNVRRDFFGGKLSQAQVDGMEAILNEWNSRGLTNIRWLAYILATVYHETGKTMQPVEEYGKGKGRKYGIQDRITGKVYYGRGLVQLTWKGNYQTFSERLGVDLVNYPEMMLQMGVSVKVLFDGMIYGLFTGKKLSDYFGSSSAWASARKVINGTDRASLIAGYAKRFLAALQ